MLLKPATVKQEGNLVLKIGGLIDLEESMGCFQTYDLVEVPLLPEPVECSEHHWNASISILQSR